MRTAYVYIQSEPGLWTVGHYEPTGKHLGHGWIAESDHNTPEAAARRVAYLNGGCDADLLIACRKSAERIVHLCGMVNDFAARLGLGRKVRVEDWDDVARAAIAKATPQES